MDQQNMDLQSNNNDVYVYQILHFLISAYLVFFLQCGFSMLQVGTIKFQNAFKLVVRNLLCLSLGALGWYATGYAFAFGRGNFFIGWRNFFLIDVAQEDYDIFFLQFTFAVVAGVIAYGALAERVKFLGHVLSYLLIVMVVYPITVHWVWHRQGWLSYVRKDDRLFGSGMFDFSGSGVIHITGGFAGLAGAIILGPRLGRFDSERRVINLAGHYPIITLLGAFVLWFGWYGFIPGGQFYMTSTIIANSAVTITLSAATSCVVTSFITSLFDFLTTKTFSWDVVQSAYGALAGLVSIAAGCAVVDAWASVAIGAIGACVYIGFSRIILHLLHIDDPLDVGAVHGFCGYWGVIAAGLFADQEKVLRLVGDEYGTRYGAIMGGGVRLVRANAVGGVAVMGFSFFIMLAAFILLRILRLLRVPREIEEASNKVVRSEDSLGPVYFLKERNEKVKEIQLQHQLTDLQKDIEELKEMKKSLLTKDQKQNNGLYANHTQNFHEE